MTTCRFPAMKVLAIRREVAALADASDDLGMVTLCAEFVRDLDMKRLDHADTGCGCWEEAQKAFPFVPPQPRQTTISEVYGDVEIL